MRARRPPGTGATHRDAGGLRRLLVAARLASSLTLALLTAVSCSAPAPQNREAFKGRSVETVTNSRVSYRIVEQRLVIDVVSIVHRRDAYHS